MRQFVVALCVCVAATSTGSAALAKKAAAPKADKGKAEKADKAAEPPKEAPKGSNPEVVFETSLGKFTVRLFKDKAPKSTENVLGYVEKKFYDGTVFHRVISDFMIQGGGFTVELDKKPTGDPIENEATNGLSNKRGTFAMARTNVINSATSQFYINVKDNAQLDHNDKSFGYAVVGEITDGMDVVDKIRAVKTRCPSWTGQTCTEKIPGNLRDVPEEPVIILRAYKK